MNHCSRSNAAHVRRGLAVVLMFVAMVGLMPGAAFESVVLPVFAHHSFGVAFDVTKPVTVTGVITVIEWMNPHSHVFMDVKDKSGKVAKWKFEGYPRTCCHVQDGRKT